MKPHKVPQMNPNYFRAGMGVLGVVSLLVNILLKLLLVHSPEHNLACQEVVQPTAVVSREQVAQLLTVPERSQRRNIQAIVKEPYCRLPSLSIRAGAITERHAYPLAFDPQTSLVVLYEGKSYVGYGFKHP